MHIAILGAGRVGSTLGRRMADAGHDVVYAVRDPSDPKHAPLTATRQSVAPVANAVAHAALVVLTTSWSGAADAIASAGDLAGKILIDATNPIGPGMVLTHGTSDSGAEQVARWAPGARVVKAFNSVGMEVMANPQFGDRRSALFICGDDATAVATVSELISSLGFEPVPLGPLSRARFIEPAALVWITAAAGMGTREFSWGVLRRP